MTQFASGRASCTGRWMIQPARMGGVGPEIVLKAVSMAASLGMKTLAFAGAGGGTLAERADLAIVVPDEDFARIQEIHMALGHILCGLVEEILTSPGRA